MSDVQDIEGYTARHVAAKYGNAEEIETLLVEREKIQINTTDVRWGTALHLASEGGNASPISALFMTGVSIDPNVQDIYGCAALNLACQMYYFPGAAKALLEGCEYLKVNIRNKKGEIALHIAAKGKTALFIAAEEGHSMTFAMILDSCMDANLKEPHKENLAEVWIGT
jgi:ankyrin repeat protein